MVNNQTTLASAKLQRQSWQLGAALTASIASVLGLLYGISTVFVTKNVRDLETHTVQQEVLRTLDGFDRELMGLLVNTCDYARWDEFFNYMKTGSLDFENENLRQVYHFTDLLNIDTLAAVLPDGSLRYGQHFASNSTGSIALLPSVKTYLSPLPQQQTFRQPKGHLTGWLNTEEGPMLLAVCAITNNLQTSSPQGILMMGRVVDPQQIESLEQQVRVTISLIDLSQPLMPVEMNVRDQLAALPSIGTSSLADQSIIVVPQNSTRIAGYARVDDLMGQPIALLRVELDRDLYQQSLLARNFLGGTLITVGIIFGLLGWWLLRKLLHESHLLARSEEALAHESALRRADALYRDKAIDLEIALQDLNREKERSENLLLNILPETIVKRLKQTQSSIAEHFDEVTILFADIVDFTPLAAKLQPIDLVELLNQIFSEFDDLVETSKLEKIKTIGDAYMVAAGLPIYRPDHAEAIADLALAMQQRIEGFNSRTGEKFQIRIGINTGMVVAGVIGTKKFIYDLWGDTVNVASRMESTGEAGGIQVTQATYARIENLYEFEQRGTMQIKGKGEMETYWLRGKLTHHL